MRSKVSFIVIFLLILTMLQTGCAFSNQSEEQTHGETPPIAQEGEGDKEDEKDPQKIEKEQGEQADAVMGEFGKLLEGDGELQEVIGFIDDNISKVIAEDASLMILKLEELQQKGLPELEEKMLQSNTFFELMNQVYQEGLEIEKLDGIEDGELKALLMEIQDQGYKVEMTEGMYFPIIYYRFYGKYSDFVTPDIQQYIKIMSAESDTLVLKDAGLIIGWDEVLGRALNQEAFIGQYPDSLKIDEVKKIFERYVHLIFYGADNTPLFSFDKKMLRPDVKTSYMEAVAAHPDSQLMKAVGEFLDVLSKAGDKLVEDVESFREKTIEKLIQ